MGLAQPEPVALAANELLMDHKQRLDEIAAAYDPSSPRNDFDYWFVRLGFETIARNLADGPVLELGSSTGLMTQLLSEIVPELVVVEGSGANLEMTRQRIGGSPRSGEPRRVSYIQQLWQEYTPGREFDNILMVRGLEHIAEPVELLASVREWLTRSGRLHIIVPNARSLHRRIGVYMGLLRSLHDLHEGDRRVGHQRVYDRDLLFRHLKDAGLTPLHWEGIMLKPLANYQMLDWSEELIRAFYQAGRELPDYCGEIYVWCSK
jgi:SAM-dependent methyltransferase